MTYHVTGVTVRGQRFRIVTSSYFHAMGINLYRGSVWVVCKGGHRKLLKRVMN
jgi:hypothetical protein